VARVRFGAEVLYVHRQASGAEIYFVSNQKNRAENLEAVFRVEGRAPELWDAATGTITRPAVLKAGPGKLTLRCDWNRTVRSSWCFASRCRRAT